MTYFEHKFKCISCGLHFVVCSDYKEWPKEGTTREITKGEATGIIYCPECGSYDKKLYWRSEKEGFIFQTVPGGSEFISFGE